MSVALASTWNPRGELPRLKRMVGALAELYSARVVVVSPGSDIAPISGIQFIDSVDWYGGRHYAVQHTLEAQPDHIHYCDLDRLLHWLECWPDELRQALKRIQEVGCLVMGRTKQAWSTHPRCMFETEHIFNMTFSHLLKTEGEWDFGAGSMGLRRRSADYVIRHGSPEWGWAIDAAWPLMLYRAGHHVDFFAADGLEWETPDQYRDTAADAETRAALAAEHDHSPEVWRHRAHVAHEITRVGLLAAARFPEGAL
jgi:hypothetical protein